MRKWLEQEPVYVVADLPMGQIPVTREPELYGVVWWLPNEWLQQIPRRDAEDVSCAACWCDTKRSGWWVLDSRLSEAAGSLLW